MTEKRDRRRKYAKGDLPVRLTISMPESQYVQMLENAGAANASEFIRNALTFWHLSQDDESLQRKGLSQNLNILIHTETKFEL